MKVAIYARVSTEEQTYEQQLQPLRAFVAGQNDWVIVKEYVEKESAFAEGSDRKQFKEMLDAARQRKFDLLLVWSFDRFSRGGVFATIPLLHTLRQYGVNFKSLTEPFLDSTSETFELIMPIFSWIAKQESKHKSERLKAKFAWKRKENKPTGRASQTILMKAQGIPEKILELKKQGKSLREITRAVQYQSKDGKMHNVSLGYVHLTCKKRDG